MIAKKSSAKRANVLTILASKGVSNLQKRFRLLNLI
jgi:hypothetical protein